MTTTSVRREQIAASLQDKEYRDLFVAEEIDTGLPFQIRALRKVRGWSQRQLAERVGMTQEGISRLESLNYGRYSLATLKRLASVFDVALVVRFESFSRLIDRAASLSPEDVAVPDYEHDPGLHPAAGIHLPAHESAESSHPFSHLGLDRSHASRGVRLAVHGSGALGHNIVSFAPNPDWSTEIKPHPKTVVG